MNTLYTAVCNNDLVEVTALLTSGEDVNKAPQGVFHKGSILYEAVYRKVDIEIVRMLINHGSMLTAFSVAYPNVLHVAAAVGYEEAFDYLFWSFPHLSNPLGPNQHVRDQKITHLLRFAIQSKSKRILDLLLDPEYLERTKIHFDFHLEHFLGIAVMADNLYAFEQLANRGAPGNYAFVMACRYGKRTWVDRLVMQFGPQIWTKEDGVEETTALYVVHHSKDLDLIREVLDHSNYLQPRSAGKTFLFPVLQAALEEPSPVLDFVLEYLASRHSKEELEKFLNRKDSEGRTALVYDHFNFSNVEAIKSMIRAGADITIQTDEGNIFHFVVESNEIVPEVLSYLLSQYPSGWMIENKDGDVPLAVSEYEYTDYVAELVEKKL